MQKNTTSLKVPRQKEIIKAIKDNDEATLKEVYQDNYSKVEKFVLGNSGTIDEAKDIFQEAFIAMWNNLKEDKFVPQSESALNGYLYQIAKNKWMDHLRSAHHRKTVAIGQHQNIHSLPEEQGQSLEEEDKKLSSALHAFNAMKEGCKSLLSQFYYEKKSLKEIASDLNMDPASVRNKKYRCMQELRALAIKKWPKKIQ